MSFLFVQALTGLADAAALFIVASGLTIIFGVTRVVNFAHGSLYMLGAYTGFSLAGALGAALGPALGFWLAIPLAALAVGLLGVAMELVVLRPLARAPELFPLVATFGVVLVVQDATLAIWGPEDLLGPRAPGLSGAVELFGRRVPEYDLFLIAVCPVLLAGLWLLFHRSRFGILVRAATGDREMAEALGVDQRFLLSGVFFLGAALAGLGGALQLPREPVTLLMDLDIIAEVFVVTVIGGMGSVGGAFVAAVIIGLTRAFGIVVLPEITLVAIFLVMAVVLVLRPYGLFGRAPAGMVLGEPALTRPLRAPGRNFVLLAAAALVPLALLPFALGGYGTSVATEMLIFALFAASLHLIMGPGGLISFGHAAYFGLGAYGAALVVTHLGWPMPLAILAGIGLALAGAAVFAGLALRLTGVYLAMLTLAFAQIVWSTAFQWYDVTGGDNGLLGIWPPRWLYDPAAYYWLCLALGAVALAATWAMIFSPFGYQLRAVRDAPARAAALGIVPRRRQRQAFVASGGLAGLAGALFAFHKGSVFPDLLAIPQSVDALVMVLLGGVQSLTGPVFGAALWIFAKIGLISATDHWRGLLGLIIIALCIALPGGLATLRDLFVRRPA